MAKENEKDASGTGMGMGDLIKLMIVAIVLGGGAGAAFGYFVVPDSSLAPQGPTEHQDQPKQPLAGRFPSDALEIEIPSIIVELVEKTRVRLDISLIAVHGTPDTTSLKSEVREDIIGYLKGLSVSDIQGVRGFQYLRQQLDDRARIRGRGAILGLLISGFVVE